MGKILKYLMKSILYLIICLVIINLLFDVNIIELIILAIICFYSIFFLLVIVNENIINNVKFINKRKSKMKKIKYEREIINEYSPLICAKLIGKEIFNQDVITAMILYLKEKQMIIIDEKQRIIINKNVKMLEHESFFIEKSQYIFYDLYNNTKTRYMVKYAIIEYLEKLVYQDMLKIGLVQKINDKTITNKYEEKNYALNILEVMPILYMVLNFLFIGTLLASPNLELILIIKIILKVALITNVIVYLINKLCNLTFCVIKTEKADVYTERLLAQKRYLKEFSQISKRSIKEEILWEHYIKMAIFFDLKGKLDKDANEYYIKTIEIYGCKEFDEERFGNILTIVLIFPWVLTTILADGLIQLMFLNVIAIIIYLFLIKKRYRINEDERNCIEKLVYK